MANSGGGAFASSNNNAVTAAAAAAATSSSSGYSSNILEPLSAPVPGAVLSSDMARIESVVYPWKGAPGAAEHSGLVTLHAALEIVADYSSSLVQPAWVALADSLFASLHLDALPNRMAGVRS